MTGSPQTRVAARRAAVEREILDASWQLMEREGVAALNVREVARAVGLRQQSLTYYFPTKQALLDALFADGFVDLEEIFDALPDLRDPIDGVVAVGDAVAAYFSAHPARYHLMFQQTVPGFRPSDESHAVALRCLQVLIDRLAAAGITKPDDIALVRGVMSGLASEQLANEPGGRQYISQVERGLRAILAALAPSTDERHRRQKNGRR
jgi:AcrR family transcriptional regulator